MAYQVEKFIEDLRNSEGRKFVEDRGVSINRIQPVTQQTMHDVFYVPGTDGKRGAYVKIAKKGRDNQPDRREMEVEALWYNIFRDRLELPGAPQATTFPLGENDFALAVEEVPGKTYDAIFKKVVIYEGLSKLLRGTALNGVLNRSAEITAKAYLLHLKNPDDTPAYFGDLHEEEFNFLNDRTLKILREHGKVNTDSLERLLIATKPVLTKPEIRLFYRDATPLNWIELIEESTDGKSIEVAAVDLGSTSYRPPQFELIALLETPNTGVDLLDEEQREEVILRYREKLKSYGTQVSDADEFLEVYALACTVKNASGVASRVQHIVNNRKEIETGNEDVRRIAEERLLGNIEGRNFHARRLRTALRKSEPFYQTLALNKELRNVLTSLD